MRRSTFGHLDAWYCSAILTHLHLTCYIRIADWKNVQVFELVVNNDLFMYEAYEQYGLDAPAGHLWQMMCFTGERFTPEQLDSSDFADQYFDNTCSSFSTTSGAF
jgi:serine/threonine-protein kinase SRPK3